MDLSSRKPGPDVVRALAMAGVVIMNYHGYLVIRGAKREGGALYDLFDPWTGPLSTRFAATFVLTAGVGVTLMTRSSIGDADRVTEMRWRLVRRGLVLYAGGLLFDFVWPGTILPFYGAMFVIASVLFTLRIRWIAAIGVTAVLAGWAIHWWTYERQLDNHATDWLTNPGGHSPRGLLFDVFVNGTHPLLPWLGFFCAGIVLGRLFATTWWRPATVGAGFVMYAAATLANSAAGSARAVVVLSDDPFRARHRLLGERTRHRADRVRRDRLVGRPVPRIATRRCAPTRRADVAHDLPRSRLRVQSGGRHIRHHRTERHRHRAGVRHRVLDSRDRGRGGVSASPRPRTRRARVSTTHVLTVTTPR